ncbi:MAG TPA: MT-A70 family methyltransferase [Solirubrobacteraceae bacterium]|jgi:N6-adenosine-specific RNA methylase IME4
MSEKRYRTIVADPPWDFRWTGGAATRTNGRGERHTNHKFKAPLPYQTMSIEALAALRVSELAAPAAHLYLWTTDDRLLNGDAVRVAEAWGFTARRTLVWVKRGIGLGHGWRPGHEIVLLCRRGSLPFGDVSIPTAFEAKRPYMRSGRSGGRDHSAKPHAFLDFVEQVSPGPYLELFARRARFGWDYWGDQSLGTAEMPERVA